MRVADANRYKAALTSSADVVDPPMDVVDCFSHRGSQTDLLLPDQKRHVRPHARFGGRMNSVTTPVEPCPARADLGDAALEHVRHSNDFSNAPRRGAFEH